MSTASTSTRAVTQETAEIRSLLRKLTAKVLTYCSQREVEQLQVLRQRLLDSVSKNQGSIESRIANWNSVRHLMDKDGISFNVAFLSALEKCIGDEVHVILSEGDSQRNKAVKARISEEEVADAVKGLSLVDAEEMDRMLGRDSVIHQFNSRYEEILIPLNQHIRGLFDTNSPLVFSNPYRPEVMLRAFTRALKAKGITEQACEDVMLAMHPKHWIDLTALYQELDQLVERSGLSSDKHRVRKSTNSIGASGSGWGRTATGAFASTGYGSVGGVPALPSHYGDLQSGFGPMAQGSLPGRYDPSVTAGYSQYMATGFGVGQPGVYGPGTWGVPSRAKVYLQQLGVQTPKASGFGRSGLSANSRIGNWGAVSGLADSHEPLEPYLISYLEELQAQAVEALAGSGRGVIQPGLNILRDLHEDEQFLRNRDPDRGTLDALAEIFDFVFADTNIPAALKVVIGRLQIPVLKAALLNREFFLSANHPARKLIDTLAAASVGWSDAKGVNDPLYQQIETCVKRILAEFNEDLALFTEAELELDEFLRNAERQVVQEVAPVVQQVETEESLEFARTQVDFALHPRIAALPENSATCAFLVPFLTQQWREVLARAMANQATLPDEYPQLVGVTDQLIWSTQHKSDAAERKQLIMLLPSLVKHINAQLDQLPWTGAERDSFTQQLIATHMNALRSVPDDAASAFPDSDDRQASEAAIRALDERVAEALEGEMQGVDRKLPELKRGMWFEIATREGQLLRCRLTWISPKRTRFLFTNREGFDAFVRSEVDIQGWLASGALKPLAQEPIVERALSQIMGTGQENSAAGG